MQEFMDAIVKPTAAEGLELRRVPVPVPGPGEVLIRMKAVGVCGSDVSYFVNGRTGVGEIRFPHILGHECAGLVAAFEEKAGSCQCSELKARFFREGTRCLDTVEIGCQALEEYLGKKE